MLRYYSAMNAAPAWVTYASLVVATLAMGISGISAVYTSRSYRRAGVSVRTVVTWDVDEGKMRCNARVLNSGLSPVDIAEIHLAIFLGHYHVSMVKVSTLKLTAGPTLPARLEGSSTRLWAFTVPYVPPDAFKRALEQSGAEPPWAVDRKLSSRLSPYRTFLLMRFNPTRFFTEVIGLQVVVQLGNTTEISSRPDFRALAYLIAPPRY